jgi:DNA-binding transcriptional LysR family regulator
MNLKQLEFAVALAEEGNFTRAAERCHVVQSALSHQIAYLEQELGTPLFERLPRQVRATAAGEALLVHARQVLASLRHLRADVAAVSGEVRGLLAIGQISSLTDIDVVAMLAAFQQVHPQVEFQLRVDKSEDLIAQVQSRDLDVALVGLAPRRPGRGLPPDAAGRRSGGGAGAVAPAGPARAAAIDRTAG